jgi:YceI-like domain
MGCDMVTRREGMLSPVGHDLRLRAKQIACSVDHSKRLVSVRIAAASIGVVCALDGDHENHGALSDGDRRKITESLHNDILNVRKFPEICASLTWKPQTSTHIQLTGTLTLHGVTRPVSLSCVLKDEQWQGHLTLDYIQFGIKLFTAFFGALKVRREVLVQVSVKANSVKEGSHTV